MRYHALALAVFGGEIGQFDHIRETVELRDSSKWRVNMDYTCFYCVRDKSGAAPSAIVTRSNR